MYERETAFRTTGSRGGRHILFVKHRHALRCLCEGLEHRAELLLRAAFRKVGDVEALDSGKVAVVLGVSPLHSQLRPELPEV
jgi:hypothetical protein